MYLVVLYVMQWLLFIENGFNTISSRIHCLLRKSQLTMGTYNIMDNIYRFTGSCRYLNDKFSFSGGGSWFRDTRVVFTFLQKIIFTAKLYNAYHGSIVR